MRVNLTKKDLINSFYMQIGFSKKISANLLDDILMTITENLKDHHKLKISKFGTFTKRLKKSRQGRNPITKENKLISTRNVILFKPSKEFKNLINSL
jgi:integration host factor subunit alpha